MFHLTFHNVTLSQFLDEDDINKSKEVPNQNLLEVRLEKRKVKFSTHTQLETTTYSSVDSTR
jgi:hypothetical protein